MKTEVRLNEKVDHVCHNIKRSLGVVHESEDLQGDNQDFLDIIARLKGKYDQNTTRSEKMQILTLLPLSWSARKVALIMDCTEYMAKTAKKLTETSGILSHNINRVRMISYVTSEMH